MKITSIEFKSPRGLDGRRTSLWSENAFPGSTMTFDGQDFVFTPRDKKDSVAIPYSSVAQYTFKSTQPGRPKKDENSK